ncbi:hypothetical protein CEXT_177721 [Caerostris extrusa]|uniref:Uncharacterized protein n=1 Tax=Caerostris extrusa TaxID=172846 RepID=A0AAV4R3S0_CAEEX|nr:hypothetical protein CEXT_177721 [Caerostris extrusa]
MTAEITRDSSGPPRFLQLELNVNKYFRVAICWWNFSGHVSSDVGILEASGLIRKKVSGLIINFRGSGRLSISVSCVPLVFYGSSRLCSD